MFGVLSGAASHLSPDLRARWVGHLCGVCVTLGANHGQLARFATNEDAAILSVLVEAQSRPVRTRSHTCPLRGMRTAQVTAMGEPAGDLAATAALTMAAAKLTDHVQDGDLPRWAAPPARAATGRATRRARGMTARSGLPVAAVQEHVARQRDVEAHPNAGFGRLAAPTARAAATVFATTADAANRPTNVRPLRRAGAAFGRIVYLLDAVEDLDEDAAAGRANPWLLVAPDDRISVAHRRYHHEHRSLVTALDRLQLEDDRLLRALLVRELDCRAHRILTPDRHRSCPPHRASGDLPPPPAPHPQPPAPRPPPGPGCPPIAWVVGGAAGVIGSVASLRLCLAGCEFACNETCSACCDSCDDACTNTCDGSCGLCGGICTECGDAGGQTCTGCGDICDTSCGACGDACDMSCSGCDCGC